MVTSSPSNWVGRAPQFCRALGPLPSSWPLSLIMADVRAGAAAPLGASGMGVKGKVQRGQSKLLSTSLSGIPGNRLCTE